MSKAGSFACILGALAAACAGLLGCSSPDDPSQSAAGTSPTGGPPASGPTYHKDIVPILQKSCQSCHQPGEIAPFALTSYHEASSVAGLMAIETEARRMPPWGARETPDCTPTHGFRNDVRLTEQEIATIKAWSEAGAPEGDPKDAPAPIDPPSNELTGVEQELTPAKPYVTQGDSDEFRCFVMDPKLTQVAFINGTHVIPGNSKVVHHAVLFADPEAKSLKKVGSDGSYDCFGGTGLEKQQLLAVWTPGGVPFELPQNIGVPIAAGSLLVMQIHYHPAGTVADPDTTKIQLRFNKTKPDYWLAPATPIGNFAGPLGNGDGLLPGPNDGPGGPVFKIPADAADHVEEMQYTIPATGDNGDPLPEIFIYGAGAHMHYVGTDMKIEVTRDPASGQPERECLLHEPAWNFDWQRFYEYDAAIDALPRLGPNDKVHLTCRYNNSLDNPFVIRALKDANMPSPQDVYLGEQTLNEMCLVMMPLLYKAPL